MPVTPTFPGVYIEEIPSGVHTIAGVATSIAAFVDYFKRGALNKAIQIFNMGDFTREFGGLDADSEASYAIQQFFLNGGSEAWVVRVAGGTPTTLRPSTVRISNNLGGASALTITAISEGSWGDQLSAQVDTNAPVSSEFNLFITEYDTVNGRLTQVQQEVFRNLSMDTSKPNYVQTVVNDKLTGSKLVTATRDTGNTPLANGTLSGGHASNPTIPASPTIQVKISDGTVPGTITGDAKPLAVTGSQSLQAIAPALEAAIRAGKPDNALFSSATVDVVGNQLRVLAGIGNAKNILTFTQNATTDALKFTNDPGATANVQQYALGGGSIASTGQAGGQTGLDGTLPDATALIGDFNSKSGVYALRDVDLFNLLCIPRTSIVGASQPAQLTATQAAAVISVAEQFCEQRRAFFIMDTPGGVDSITEIKDWLNANATLRHQNAALYFPRVEIPDPLNNFRLRSAGASGTIAGLYARTDGARGVWKAPAGTEASLRNVSELDDVLTDAENGALNPLGINCLRNFPVYGNVAWGARTLFGADQMTSEWKYVPVRRTALFLEESLYRGTQWVVFEPNDEPLWAQIRLNVGAFMQSLFRQGAFQGKTPRDAYFVKCDSETTTQTDINNGIVNIVVGFAPLKPAEFVIIKLQQMAGQIQT